MMTKKLPVDIESFKEKGITRMWLILSFVHFLPRDDASIVPYKSLFLFAAKFYLSSPSIHFLPRHHTKNAHSARYLSALCAFC